MRVMVYAQHPARTTGMGRVSREIAAGLAAEHELHYYAPDAIEGMQEFDFGGNQGFLHGSPGHWPGRGHFPRVVNRIDPDLFVTNRNWQSLNWLHNPFNSRYTDTTRLTPIVLYGPPVETEQYPPHFKNQLVDDHLNSVYMIPYTENQYDQLWDGWDVTLENNLLPKEVGWVPHGVDHDTFEPNDGAAAAVRGSGTFGLEGVDYQRFRGLGIGDRTMFLCVAENWRRKRLDLLYNAFAGYLDQRPDDGDNPVLVLHSAPSSTRGDDFYGGWQLAKTAAAFDLDVATSIEAVDEDVDTFHTVEFVGQRQPDEYLAALYNAADAYVLPTCGESFSMTTLEAHACRTPVLQTDLETLRWVSGDDGAEWIDPAQKHAINNGEIHVTPSVEDMVEGLSAVTFDTRASGLVANAAKRAQDFSWERTREEFNEAIEAVVEEEGI